MKLRIYLLKRTLLSVPVILVLTILIFVMTRMIGDPVAMYVSPGMDEQAIETIRKAYGLDQPLYIQYFYYLKGLLRGDLGYSESVGVPVLSAILRFLPATVELAIFSFIISVVIGIWLGTLSAVHRDTPLDHINRLIALSGYSLPRFWLGLVLMFLIYYKLGLVSSGRLSLSVSIGHFPPYGNFTTYTGLYLPDAVLNGDWIVFQDALKHLILPAFTLAYSNVAIVMRVIRASMLEVLNEPYILTAKAKGVKKKDVINKHVRKNALISTSTVIGLLFSRLLAGSVVTEIVFAWPGLGNWAAQAALQLDRAAILGFCMFIGVTFIMINLFVDVLYTYLDPRIKVR